MIKDIIVKIIVAVLVFLATVFLVNKWDNTGMDEVSAEMAQPTLPLVYMETGSDEVNCLHGYTSSIDASLFHDSITPIGTDQTVNFQIETVKSEIDTVGYEVRTVDGSSLIENGEVDEIQEANGAKQVKTTLRMNLQEAQEYTFIVCITMKDGREVRYYTRLIPSDRLHTGQFLQFVNEFHEATFNKENKAAITKYIEPNDSGENENLSHIDIHSNYESFTWANLSMMRISRMTPTIKELDETNATIALNYVAISGEVDNAQYYNVTEVYRLKYVDSTTIYLMDFDRNVETIFDRFDVNTLKNWFFLGISDEDNFQYRVSDENEKVAFVKEGQLWYYDYGATTITKVFAFWQDTPTDIRSAYDQHGINIVKLDDNGNMVFTVYGYMNRGDHEGENGIAVYRFLASTSRLEEVLFISCDEPYEILKEDAPRLTYLNEKNEFFYMLGDNVMKIDLATGESSYVIQGIPKEYLAVSGSECLLAYPNASVDRDSTQVTIMNLETYEEHTVDAGSGQRIKAIGFIEDDLAYGLANESEVVLNTDGSTIFPMHTLKIATLENQVVKEYSKSGIYVMEAYTGKQVIHMTRATKSGDNYVEAPEDFITFKEADGDGVQVSYQYTYDAYNQLYMIFPNYMYVTSVPELIMTKEVLNDDNKSIAVDSGEKSERYYVYAQGTMQRSYSTPRGAILAAYEESGLALDSRGNCIWRISGLLDYAEVTEGLQETTCASPAESLQECIKMILQYEKAELPESMDMSGNANDILQRYLDKAGVNLVGCDVDNALFYLCQGAPVVAKLDADTYVLIISYNETTIRYYNPVTGEEVRELRYELEKTFAEQGNQFFTYVH